MASEREERIARNEALFKAANERMAAWAERQDAEGTELYFCECADTECTEKIALRQDDYERVRSEPNRFFVLPGHVVPDAETVVESHGDWLVVEKPLG